MIKPFVDDGETPHGHSGKDSPLLVAVHWHLPKVSCRAFSYENESFGSHADRFFREAWAFGYQEKCPRIVATAVANTLAVATYAIFIRGCEPEKVRRGFFYENGLKTVIILSRIRTKVCQNRTVAPTLKEGEAMHLTGREKVVFQSSGNEVA